MLTQGYQNYYGGGMPYMGTGVGYNQQQPAPVLNNFLTPEQMSEIQHGQQQFPSRLTRDEFMRTICTHKSNNRIMLDKQADGQHHCSICDKSFVLFDTNTPDETIYGICKNMHDLMQTIKTYMLNAPEDLKDIYMMLGFIEKIPLLWKSAVKSFEQASNMTQFGLQNNPQQDAFQMLGQMVGGMGMPGMMGGGYYGQPPYGMQPNGYGMMPPTAPPPQPVQPTQPQAPAAYAPNSYGYNPSYVMGQQPAQQAPMAYGQNPIGYVEPQQPQGMAQTQVNITPAAPGQAIPLNNDAPVNPNLQTPEKVDVNKTFAPAPAV